MTETTMQTTATETTAEETPAPPEELGGWRIAGLLSERLGVEVTMADIDELVTQEHLVVVDHFKGRPMYETAAALALDEDLVRGVVAERLAWEAASVPRDAAAARIGWHWRDIERMGEEGRITLGKGRRYLITDLEALAAEADGEQYITAQAAADVLEIRYPSDWRYVEAAGWVAPADTYEREVGRHRTVTVALYRLGDVRDLRGMPGVDWESIRGLPKGAVSPLREYAALAPTRSAVVKGFAQALADRHHTTVWAWNSPYSGGWELDWERVDDGPTEQAVRRELLADPATAPYASEITLCPEWGEVTRIARELLEPDAAVIIDTETTDLPGQTVEVAVIDAATGKKLMNTLVRPTEPISNGARWVHGITDEMVADARPFEKVLPRLRQVTKGKIVCAYNADFDRGVVLGDIRRAGKKPLHLEPWDSWYCLMEAYKDWLGAFRWLRLGGSHRALGDCESARKVLIRMSKGRGTTFTPTPPAPGDPVAGPPAGSVIAAVAVPDA
ncbi:3'-5' exonuclease [Streptomyces acidiscabies]|uniref:3'-5' exonuclease n=1 Tax=Streptomyces acidiscabies TaxID=42234 RepID=A0ABU4MBA5_9ACTN|nr:3'-5' exonuclease [Streptomyces acidiscabies]MDX3025400.1 3'-5' exonuclease [Streptomyces acidiscabies]